MPCRHKFMQQVEQILIHLPRSMEWRTFYRYDLPLLTDIYPELQKASVKHVLKKMVCQAVFRIRDISKILQEFPFHLERFPLAFREIEAFLGRVLAENQNRVQR